jgi:hypothetical protein
MQSTQQGSGTCSVVGRSVLAIREGRAENLAHVSKWSMSTQCTHFSQNGKGPISQPTVGNANKPWFI